MKLWGFGIIGCGAIAEVHLQAIGEIADARRVIVASRRAERAQSVALQAGCAWTADYREVLHDPEVDIVCLTTGSGSHGRLGLEALQAGKHLLVEKPLAMTVAEADALITLAADKGLTLSVVSQSRFMPHHQLAKQAIAEGRLGRLLLAEVSRPYYRTQEYYDSADWRGTLAEDGGALMNQGIHAIDLLLWMAGRVRTVSGRVATLTHRMEAEDLGLATLTLEDGGFAAVMCSTSIVPGFVPSMHLYGEKGTIRIEGPAITHWSVPGLPQPEYRHDSTVGGGARDPRGISHEYHKRQIAEFIAAVQEHRKPAVTGEEGRDAVRLIERIHESSARGGMPVEF